MNRRFVSIWFRHLTTDWFAIRQPALKNESFVLGAPVHGRMVITAVSAKAQQQGINAGMVLADARAILPGLCMLEDVPGLADKLLARLAEWCIRFTPVAAVDPPNGLILDASGCAHLWGGEASYLKALQKKLEGRGYSVRLSMAGSIGAAWALARYGRDPAAIKNGWETEALLSLAPQALRLETATTERLHKLGLSQIGSFIAIPRSTLRRRFGQHFITRLNQALGLEEEMIQPVQPFVPHSERLPCLEPIVTLTGIEIALQRLLESLCHRLQRENKGLRKAVFKSYRVDGKTIQVEIGTNRPSHNTAHLFKLFENKLPEIEPDLGIELFVLEAPSVEDHYPAQEKCWETAGGLDDPRIAELLDRLTAKLGAGAIHRYLPAEHYWPEHSIQPASSLQEQAATAWAVKRPRPLHLLPRPEPVEVTAPIPDYPPMLFRYKGKLHKIVKADGPERIEQEWWLHQGQHRDYYAVEDEQGCRYWLFRLGHYDTKKTYQWFVHGFFA